MGRRAGTEGGWCPAPGEASHHPTRRVRASASVGSGRSWVKTPGVLDVRSVHKPPLWRTHWGLFP